MQILGPHAVAIDLDLGAEIAPDAIGLRALRLDLHHPHIAGVINVDDRQRPDRDRRQLVLGVPGERLGEPGTGLAQQVAGRIIGEAVGPRRRRRVQAARGVDVAARHRSSAIQCTASMPMCALLLQTSQFPDSVVANVNIDLVILGHAFEVV